MHDCAKQMHDCAKQMHDGAKKCMILQKIHDCANKMHVGSSLDRHGLNFLYRSPNSYDVRQNF